MKRKILCMLLSVLLVLSALPMASVAGISESKPLLSEISESECIAFVKECGIELPTIYDDEAEWGPFVKGAITLFENNPNAPITISYTVTAKLAKEIRNAVNDYYGITSTYTGQRMLNAYTASSTGLLYSTVYAEWDPDFEKYNCYSYVLGITDVKFNPGMITAMEKYPSNPEKWNIDILNITIEEIRDSVIEDLETRGETRIIYEGSAMDTSNLCTNESVICVRKGSEDYHFMKYTTDGWLHKPGETQILKYNTVPNDMDIWTNEAVSMGVYIEATKTYDSTIYFISYNGHDWHYTYNGDGAHTKSCSICEDAFTSDCNYDYTYIGNDKHSASCVDCNSVISGTACSFTYTSNDDGTHTRSCNQCSNAYTESCDLEYTNLTNTRHSVACAVCDYYVNSQLCTLTYTSKGNQTHTASCTLCGNSYINDCSFVSTYIDADQHRRECNRCGYEYIEDCFLENTYCGDDTTGDVHKKMCQTCGYSTGSGTVACTFAYKSNGENTHVYACTQCRYIKSGPSACSFLLDGYCRSCGAYKDSAVINREEEEFLS